MADDTHPFKLALLDLAEWHDRWRDEPGLGALVDAVREACIRYVAAHCEVPRVEGKVAEVIPLRPRQRDS